jgi:3-dehydroquinate synthetase
MRAAARIAAWSGICSPTLVREQDELLASFGLPGRLPKIDAARVLSAMRSDKKVRHDEIQWVLPIEMGRAEPRRRADSWFVKRAVREVLGA